MLKYFKKISGVGIGKYIYFWKSKGLSVKELIAASRKNYCI